MPPTQDKVTTDNSILLSDPGNVTDQEIRRRQLALLDLQIAEAAEARDAKLKNRQQADLARRQGAELLLRKIEIQKVVQARCRHRHPEDDKPFVSAIKFPGGRMSITCANEACMKSWEGTIAELRNNPELAGLFPPDDQIGGFSS